MSKPALTDDQIRVACEWWAARITRPTFNALRPEERRREDSQPMAVAEIMAASMVEDINEGAVARFQLELAQRLHTDEQARWGIGVDYGPDRILSEAAAAAGIKVTMMTFPWKSFMSFHDGKVEAYCGYGQPFETLYEPKQ